MNSSIESVYLDYAATTPVDPQVLDCMQPYWNEQFGNASSTHGAGHGGRRAVDKARDIIAAALNARASEVIFTAGGTESDNIAIQGAMRAAYSATGERGHMVTTAIEHPAVKDTCDALAKEGFELTVVAPGRNGIVTAESVAEAVRPNTVLVTVMYANNEVGSIQPIAEITKAVKEVNANALVHTDACQAAGALSLDTQELEVDLLTINASKIYGPKGIGALYIKRGVQLQPIQFGGGQEQSLRPGTENVPAIVGFGAAVELAEERRQADVSQKNSSARIAQLRDKLEQGILESIPGTQVNGDIEHRLPNNTNILFDKIDGDTLLISLDQAGIRASLGSACAAGSVDPSHVLLAMGLDKKAAKSSVRFTVGKSTTQEEIDWVLEKLPGIIERVRSL